MIPRVVITGMGVVSPNGIGKEAFCRAVLAGKSGVKRISRFDPSSLPVHVAGEIPEFDELAWMDARERKHVSRVVPLAIAASTEALQDAGSRSCLHVDGRKAPNRCSPGHGRRRAGIFRRAIPALARRSTKQVSVFCIPSGTMGTIPSEINMRFGFRGYSHVVTAGCTSSTDALGYAYQHIQARGVLPIFWSGAWTAPSLPESSRGTPYCGRSRTRGTMHPSVPRARFPPTATVLCWPKARGCLSSKNTNTPAPAARASTPKLPDTAPPAKRLTACA